VQLWSGPRITDRLLWANALEAWVDGIAEVGYSHQLIQRQPTRTWRSTGIATPPGSRTGNSLAVDESTDVTRYSESSLLERSATLTQAFAGYYARHDGLDATGAAASPAGAIRNQPVGRGAPQFGDGRPQVGVRLWVRHPLQEIVNPGHVPAEPTAPATTVRPSVMGAATADSCDQLLGDPWSASFGKS